MPRSRRHDARYLTFVSKIGSYRPENRFVGYVLAAVGGKSPLKLDSSLRHVPIVEIDDDTDFVLFKLRWL